MKKQRKQYTPEEKVAILRRHLLEKEPISKLCDEVGLPPTVFYRGRRNSSRRVRPTSSRKYKLNHSAEQKRIAYLDKKIQDEGRGSGRADGGTRRAKKGRWGTLTGTWVPHDTRD
jgi:transposase-like protein